MRHTPRVAVRRRGHRYRGAREIEGGMAVDVLVGDDGRLHFVTSGGQRIATLSRHELGLLWQLLPATTSGPVGRMFAADLRAYPLRHFMAVTSLTTVRTGEPVHRMVRHTERLGLTRSSAGGVPALTPAGERLLAWLVHTWGGWAAYHQRFPPQLLLRLITA
jgi:hypothetical protein